VILLLADLTLLACFDDIVIMKIALRVYTCRLLHYEPPYCTVKKVSWIFFGISYHVHR